MPLQGTDRVVIYPSTTSLVEKKSQQNNSKLESYSMDELSNFIGSSYFVEISSQEEFDERIADGKNYVFVITSSLTLSLSDFVGRLNFFIEDVSVLTLSGNSNTSLNLNVQGYRPSIRFAGAMEAVIITDSSIDTIDTSVFECINLFNIRNSRIGSFDLSSTDDFTSAQLKIDYSIVSNLDVDTSNNNYFSIVNISRSQIGRLDFPVAFNINDFRHTSVNNAILTYGGEFYLNEFIISDNVDRVFKALYSSANGATSVLGQGQFNTAIGNGDTYLLIKNPNFTAVDLSSISADGTYKIEIPRGLTPGSTLQLIGTPTATNIQIDTNIETLTTLFNGSTNVVINFTNEGSLVVENDLYAGKISASGSCKSVTTNASSGDLSAASIGVTNCSLNTLDIDAAVTLASVLIENGGSVTTVNVLGVLDDLTLSKGNIGHLVATGTINTYTFTDGSISSISGGTYDTEGIIASGGSGYTIVKTIIP